MIAAGFFNHIHSFPGSLKFQVRPADKGRTNRLRKIRGDVSYPGKTPETDRRQGSLAALKRRIPMFGAVLRPEWATVRTASNQTGVSQRERVLANLLSHVLATKRIDWARPESGTGSCNYRHVGYVYPYPT